MTRRLRLSPDTVRSHLRRSRSALRARLEAEHGGDRASFAVALLSLAEGARLGAPLLGTLSLGALAMSTKSALGLVGALVLAALAAWRFLPLGGTGSAPAPSVGESSPVAAAAPSRPTSEPPAPATTESATERREAVASAPAGSASVARFAAVEGRVLDAQGLPVSGAHVLAFRDAAAYASSDEAAFRDTVYRLGIEGGGAFAEATRTRTGADGAFRFEELAPSEAANVFAFSPEHGVALAARQALRAGETLRIELRFAEGIELFGAVTDESGRPIPGVHVSLFGSDASGSYSHVGSPRTDAEGAWRSFPIACRSFMVSASAPGRADADVNLRDIPRGETRRRVDLVLAPARTLRGRLVREDGSPARLGALELDPAFAVARGQRDREGGLALFASFEDPAEAKNFRSLGHERGELHLDTDAWEVSLGRGADDFVSLWWGNVLLGSLRIEQNSSGGDLVVRFDRIPEPSHLSLDLRVVHRDTGEAVRRYSVTVATSSSSWRHRRAPVEVDDASGQVRLQGLEAGEQRMTVEASGFVPRTARVLLAAGGGTELLVLELAEPRASIAGVVVDGAGSPVNGARIHVLQVDGMVSAAPGAQSVESNAEGRFSIEGLATGPVDLLLEHKDWAGLGRRIDVLEGENEVRLVATLGEVVVFLPLGADGPFGFEVYDTAGVPQHSDAAVSRNRFGAEWKMRVPAGSLIAEAHCPGFETASVPFLATRGARVEFPMRAVER